jgi:putative cardiolipin synthase
MREVVAGNRHPHTELDDAGRRAAWLALLDGADPGRGELLVDTPPKENPAARGEAPVQVADALVRLFDRAEREVIIVSAYLIPTPSLEGAVERAIARGVRVRILTNSIRSNNHLAAHSAYRNHIAALIGLGVQLHEVRADAADRALYMLSPTERKALALHAKALIIDDDQVFVGSANLDPRSLRINTEMGLLVRSKALNRRLRESLRPDFEEGNAWSLRLDERGRVLWIAGDQMLTAQPAESYMQRIEDWFLSHLPLEAEL